MNQIGIGLLRPCGQFVEHLIRRPRGVAETLHVEQGGLQGRRDQALQVAVRDTRLGVLGCDHLALFGKPQRSVHRSGRLGQDRVIARPAAAPDGPASAMEKPQPDPGLARRLHQIELRAVQRPVRGEVTAVLVGIGVAQHHLLAAVAGIHDYPVDRQLQCLLKDPRPAPEVVDRLEQRHDTHRRVWCAIRNIKQARLFQQQRCLQHVRHRLAHRDDVRRYRGTAEHTYRAGRRRDDVQFLAGQFRQFGIGTDQRPAGRQFGRQQRHPLRFLQRRVVRVHARPREQLGDHLLMHLGVLPHVQPAQVEAESGHRLTQSGQAVVGEQRAAVRAQRSVDLIEVTEQLLRRPIGRQSTVEAVLRLAVQSVRRGGRQPGPDHPHRAPVRFVGALGLSAGFCQVGQPRADGHQSRRQGQFLLEGGEFVEVMLEGGVGGVAGGKTNHLGGDVRIAVAVTADPRPGPHHRRDQQVRAGPASAQRVPHLGVDLGDHLEERRPVIAQAGLDLIGDLQSGQPDQRGLPQGQDVSAQLGLDGPAVHGLCLTVQSQPHQRGDAVLGVEDGAPAGLGGVGGDDR